MKIILAPDKFKGSLTALEFCDAVEKGIKQHLNAVEIVKLPLADGGDGTIDILNFYLKGSFHSAEVCDPLFRKIQGRYLYSKGSKTAFVEMAEASGFHLLTPSEASAKHTTTLGTGELILSAIDRGAKKIILGIGGSATNDCGMGMATALGYRFLDVLGNAVKPIGENLSEVVTIDTSGIDARIKDIEFVVACDVTNPLYGENGAAKVYAKQKGATAEDIDMLDKGLRHFAGVLATHFGVNPQNIPGAGAAGGMGIGSKLFLAATLIPGIEMIQNLAQFEDRIQGADWIVTGEGQLDAQTLSGKTINGVLSAAKKQGISVASFCGNISLTDPEVKDLGIAYSDAVMHYTSIIKDALARSEHYVERMGAEFAKWLLAQG